MLLDDRAGERRLGPHRPDLARRARRRRVGDQRPQVVHLRLQRRGAGDRDGRDRPRRPAAPAREHDPRARGHARLHRRAPGARDGARRGPRPLGGALRGLPGARRQPARRARRRLSGRAGPARPGPHPPLHARDRLGRARLRADVRARPRPRGVRRPAGRQAVRAGLHRQLAHGDRPGAADGAARRLEDGHRRQAGGAPGHLDDQGDRRPDAPARARPRHAGTRRARHVGRHAAGGDVAPGSLAAHRRRARRGAQDGDRGARAEPLQAAGAPCASARLGRARRDRSAV